MKYLSWKFLVVLRKFCKISRQVSKKCGNLFEVVLESAVRLIFSIFWRLFVAFYSIFGLPPLFLFSFDYFILGEYWYWYWYCTIYLGNLSVSIIDHLSIERIRIRYLFWVENIRFAANGKIVVVKITKASSKIFSNASRTISRRYFNLYSSWSAPSRRVNAGNTMA